MVTSSRSPLPARRPLRSRRDRATPVLVEAVEGRTLFAGLDIAGQAFSPGQPQLVFTDIANGSTNGSGPSAAQSFTVRNTTAAPITINAADIVDDGSVGGDHAGEFQKVNFPATPVTVPAGGNITLSVRMQAASTGLKAAVLRVQTTDATNPTYDLALRGIGTTSDSAGDVSGSNEPSLQRILNAFQIPVNVGDANGEQTFDLPTPRPAGTAHEEVEMQRLRKAGSGPVVIQSLAEYAFNTKTGPIGHFGIYTPGTKDAKTELFAVSVNERSSTNPTWGASFDPGASDFALYGDFNGSLFEINGLPRGVYSEDALNTWDPNNKKKVRFFPLKDKAGTVVPNAFVFAFEEFSSGYDSNDVIGIIRNVQAAPQGPEVGTESLDRGQPGPTRLVFNRIQQQPPAPRKEEDGTFTDLPNNVVHDRAKVRVYNTGSAALTISSAVLSNTQDFKVNTPNLNGATIQPGASLDIEVQFIAQGGRVETGTLTINTNDADEGTVVVQLAGYWQNQSENNEEPTLQELVQIYGFGTKITNEGEQLNVPGQDGKVRTVGDEILSPYWRRGDAARAVEVIQLNAFHTHNEEESFKWHFRDSTSTTTLFTHEAVDAQSFFPRLKGSSQVAAGTFKPAAQGGDTNPAFGFRIQNEWSDPTRNVQDQPGGGFGHRLRFWPLKDAAGKVVPDAYFMAMDYEGVNYDYQDNVFIIRNIRPADLVAQPPAAPAGLTATPSPAGIALNWDDNAGANLAGYNVYRGTTADFTPGAANKLNGALLTASEFSDAGAPAGTQSFYKVTAVDTGGAESSAASISATRPIQPQPGVPTTPTGLAASAVSPTEVNVNWSGSAGATRYVLERRVGSSGAFVTVADNLTGTSFANTGLAPNTTYEYRISAANTAGQSAPSAAASVKTPVVGPPPPVPVVSIADVSLSEPASGTASAGFTVSLTGPATSPVVVSFATGGGTATAGTDYTATQGTVTFAPGETSKAIDVPVIGDGLAEPAETFNVNLSVVSGGATLGDGQATGTIVSTSAEPPPGLPFGGKTVATFTGADGKPVRVSLKGPGVGTVVLNDNGTASINATGTTAASALTVTGAARLQDVTVGGSLRSFTGKTADLAGGAFAVGGSIGKLLARNATAVSSITLGAGGAATVQLGDASDVSLTSAAPLKSVKVAHWRNTDGAADALTAPSVAAMTVKGDLDADVNVTTLGKLTVGGAMNGSDLRASGNVGTVRAGAMRDSRVFAGVRDGLTAMPDSADDFVAPAAIKSVTVSGKTAGAFSDTMIAASQVGKVSLGTVTTDNGGTPFGIAADRIASATASAGTAGRFSVKNVESPSDSVTEGDFLLRLL